jgi:hypothetical protein
MRSLFIVPLKPNTTYSLRELCMDKLDEVRRTYGESLQIVVDERGSGDGHVETLDERQSHIAKIRQSILEDVLRQEYQDVFWMDADILDFEVGVIGKMMAYRDIIVAPMVLKKHDQRLEESYYDTAGFVENGQWASEMSPYFKQTCDVIELDSVGAFYKVPARVYHSGAFYYPVAGYVEHYAVCEFAKRRMGMKVLCDTRLKVFHVRLEAYGDKTHK